MSEYGYIPEAPEQSFGNNKGIFTPKDIYDLTRADKYTNYGQLELIETQTVSEVSAVNFENMQESKYNVHLITYSFDSTPNGQPDDTIITRVRTGGSYVNEGYQYAEQFGNATGTFSEVKSTSASWLSRAGDSTGQGNEDRSTGYIYCYNFGDSSKYSFVTTHHSGTNTSSNLVMHFGSSVYPTANVVDGFKFFGYWSLLITGTASLYGIRYS